MAAESILTNKKPGFPKTSRTSSAFRTTIEYIGSLTTLSTARPENNAAWGDYDGTVASTDLSPIEGTDQAELIVVCEKLFQDGGTISGTAAEVSFEVEWVYFQRSMFEHPIFAGGTYALTADDIAAIEAWKNEETVSVKAAFAYSADGSSVELSANAEIFAKGLNLGQETYEDFAPVIRRTTRYLNGLPPTSNAGLKGGDPTFAGKPTGYEWRKTADRSIQVSGRNKWDRVEEWTGAIKVLSDRAAIYWYTAP
jgi:hypothetical protein